MKIEILHEEDNLNSFKLTLVNRIKHETSNASNFFEVYETVKKIINEENDKEKDFSYPHKYNEFHLSTFFHEAQIRIAENVNSDDDFFVAEFK